MKTNYNQNRVKTESSRIFLISAMLLTCMLLFPDAVALPKRATQRDILRTIQNVISRHTELTPTSSSYVAKGDLPAYDLRGPVKRFNEPESELEVCFDRNGFVTRKNGLPVNEYYNHTLIRDQKGRIIVGTRLICNTDWVNGEMVTTEVYYTEIYKYGDDDMVWQYQEIEATYRHVGDRPVALQRNEFTSMTVDFIYDDNSYVKNELLENENGGEGELDYMIRSIDGHGNWTKQYGNDDVIATRTFEYWE